MCFLKKQNKGGKAEEQTLPGEWLGMAWLPSVSLSQRRKEMWATDIWQAPWSLLEIPAGDAQEICRTRLQKGVLGSSGKEKGKEMKPSQFPGLHWEPSNKSKGCLPCKREVSPEQTFLSLCLQRGWYFISIFPGNPSKTEGKKVSDQKGESESGRLSRLLGC